MITDQENQATETPLLSVKDLTTHFFTSEGIVKAVEGASFQIQAGRTLGIVGESGCGKSVAAKSILQLVDRPGRIVGGEVIYSSPESGTSENLLDFTPTSERMRRFRGGVVSMIFQEPMTSFSPVHTIGNQITEAIRLHSDLSKTESSELAVDWLQRVGIPNPEQSMSEYPDQFSGGQRQRAMIAMALCTNPSMLIADEPTTALDVTTQAQILELLKGLAIQNNMATLFITHDLGVIAEIADDVAVMYLGQVVETAPVEEIFNDPKHPYTKGLLACRPRLESTFKVLPTVSDYLEENEVDGQLQLSEKPGANERIEAMQQATTPHIDEADFILEVEDLHVHFPERRGVFSGPEGWVKAVDGISFSVPRGSTLGLVGESGCGKTTTGRAILNLVNPTSGMVKFNGEEIAGFDATAMLPYRKRMQIVFQDPYSSLNPRLTIEQALSEPMAVHQIGAKKDRRDRVVSLLEEVGLESQFLRRYPHEFSGGQRQRICVARALALEPEFIVCDEAVSAMDVSVQAQVLNLLRELQGNRSLTYIFISHDLSVVKFMADTIAVMREGRIVEQGDAENVYANPVDEYTRNLIAAVPRDSAEFIRSRRG